MTVRLLSFVICPQSKHLSTCECSVNSDRSLCHQASCHTVNHVSSGNKVSPPLPPFFILPFFDGLPKRHISEGLVAGLVQAQKEEKEKACDSQAEQYSKHPKAH